MFSTENAVLITSKGEQKSQNDIQFDVILTKFTPFLVMTEISISNQIFRSGNFLKFVHNDFLYNVKNNSFVIVTCY